MNDVTDPGTNTAAPQVPEPDGAVQTREPSRSALASPLGAIEAWLQRRHDAQKGLPPKVVKAPTYKSLAGLIGLVLITFAAAGVVSEAIVDSDLQQGLCRTAVTQTLNLSSAQDATFDRSYSTSGWELAGTVKDEDGRIRDFICHPTTSQSSSDPDGANITITD